MKFQFRNIITNFKFEKTGFDKAKDKAIELKNEGRLNDFLVNIYDNFKVYEENQLLTDIFTL